MGVEKLGKVLVALGGNAILRHEENGTAEEQMRNVRKTCVRMVEIIREGYDIAITHGNGPQVGDILLKNEMAKNVLPAMPLDVCGAESQGFIGYLLQQSMVNELHRNGLELPVATVLTQCLVDQNEPSFLHPSKPIGPFYTAMEASRLRQEKGWSVIDDSGRGFRRVVPSPFPQEVIEGAVLKHLFREGTVVIACGGGGVPVVKDSDGALVGVEAVIDKDHASALLAMLLGVDTLLILTDVEGAFINFGKESQKFLHKLNPEQAREQMAQGHFAAGSMYPKIEAAVHFVERGGKASIITSLECAVKALNGEKGTWITK
jgi:carbamate kinase